MTIHIMVDIETLSLQPNATILSIGACTSIEYEDFYREINPDQGRHLDINTLKFWFKQPIKPPLEGTAYLSSTLIEFFEWVKRVQAINPNEKVLIWANGTDFDIVTIKDATYDELGGSESIPWKYNEIRDYRTFAALFPEYPKHPFEGDKHNALADAKNQMKHLKGLLTYVEALKVTTENIPCQPNQTSQT